MLTIDADADEFGKSTQVNRKSLVKPWLNLLNDSGLLVRMASIDRSPDSHPLSHE